MKRLNQKMLFLSLALLANGMTSSKSHLEKEKEELIQKIAQASTAFHVRDRNIFGMGAGIYESFNTKELTTWNTTISDAIFYIRLNGGNSKNLQNAAQKCELFNRELISIIRNFHSTKQSMPEEMGTTSEKINKLSREKYSLIQDLNNLKDLQKSFKTKFHDSKKIAAFEVLSTLITTLDLAINKSIRDFMQLKAQLS